MKFVKLFLITGLFLTCSLLWTNCRKDLFNGAGQVGNQFSFSSNDGLKMSYEVETMSLQNAVNATDTSKLTTADKILGAPKVSREAVAFHLAADGSVNMIINHLEPKNPYRPKSNSLPDNSPIVAKTMISGGTASSYDKNGKLIAADAIDVENLKSVADVMTNIKIDPDKVKAFVASARTSGNLVFEKDDIIGIRAALADGGELISVYDLKRYLQLSLESHGADKTLKSRYIFFIDGDYQTPVLRGIHTQRFSKSAASGVALVSNTYQQFDDFQLINNLK